MANILRYRSLACSARKFCSRAPISLNEYIKDVRPLLKPPVANRMIYNEQLQVMVVGGPNQRKEIFYQVDGAMDVLILEHGEHKTIHIPQGHMFILPSRIPHSPQRYANTIGVVIERLRKPHESDGLRYFVPGTTDVLYEEYFYCKDLGSELVPVIQRFFASDASKSNVPHPGMPVANPPVTIDTGTAIEHQPFHWDTFIQNLSNNSSEQCYLLESVLSSREYNLNIAVGKFKGVVQRERIGQSTDTFLWQYRGSSRVWSGADENNATVMNEGDIRLIENPQHISTVMCGSDACLVAITNRAFDY